MNFFVILEVPTPLQFLKFILNKRTFMLSRNFKKSFSRIKPVLNGKEVFPEKEFSMKRFEKHLILLVNTNRKLWAFIKFAKTNNNNTDLYLKTKNCALKISPTRVWISYGSQLNEKSKIVLFPTKENSIFNGFK
jgi:hypothetical protein